MRLSRNKRDASSAETGRREAAGRAALLPWQRVEVAGPSMAPTLRDGDSVLVRHGAIVKPGDVVLARFRSMPDRLVLKRAVREQDGGWWLASDNELVGGDSAAHGVADALGRVVVRLRPIRLRPGRLRSG